MLNKLSLGTVQFGLNYGIANKIGQISREDVFKILEFAHKEGIDTLDTAYSYGESEEIIGQFISKSDRNFNIISKAPNASAITETLSRLKQTKIYGYLAHNPQDLKELEAVKQKGLVNKIGISVYNPEELNYNVDIVQAPYNIFDQRFEEYFPILKEKNIEIHTRSAFLQGLFFLEMDRIDKDFKPAKEVIEKLHHISLDCKIPIHALCLGFVLLNPFIDKVIIGVDSIEQLKENIHSVQCLDRVRNIYELLKSLKFHNEEVILPYNWK